METIGPVLKLSLVLCFKDQFVKNYIFYPVGHSQMTLRVRGLHFLTTCDMGVMRF